MKIGIVIYSQTGNTRSVATQLKEKLTAAGHTVNLEEVTVAGEVKPGQPIQFQTLPDTGPYDALVFGSPVQAFSLAAAMAGYLGEVGSLANKQVACLITQAFPFAWMGGNRAIRQMTKLCKAKGATICGSGVVNWMNSRREQQIAEVTDRLSGLFGA